ncbi:hypothetical protein [Psychromonas antarctica]|uniref:hypothetical protein n=1 Tax=Psychromonas antarctica TaxID=67573 RepID=UPI001EE7E31E|nr:hypothetical protein [Psychromonas antarctica]MCG6202892.1 hypothetical protein [Psychromonas antarctica]
MPNTEEQRLDLIENCNHLLAIFKGFEQIDDTPEGRMIAQLTWLKEHAVNHDLPLPVERVYVSTIAYIYTDGTLSHHASSKEKIDEELEIPMQRILRLAGKGQLLFKPEYCPYATRCIDALINVLKHAIRELTQYEQGLIEELKKMKTDFLNNEITPPLGSQVPNYPNYLKVDRYKPTIADLPDGKFLIKRVTDLIFNGVRPDSWLTPEDAERETLKLLG